MLSLLGTCSRKIPCGALAAALSIESPCFCRGLSTFEHAKITVSRTKTPAEKPDPSKLLFGRTFADHMLFTRWTADNGWEAPVIRPVENLQLHPAAKVLHYAQEIFEGMKAYRGLDGKVRIFRPDMNAQRMLDSAKRACLPTFDKTEWVRCVRRLVLEDVDWVPPCNLKDLSTSSTLYIRPFMIGVDPTLGVAPATEVWFIVMTGPVGPYYPTGFKPVSLLADPALVRSWPGGTGCNKMGANYAPTLALQKVASDQGCQQVLWLHGRKNLLTEVGTMNVFVHMRPKSGSRKSQLITPTLSSGLILPGVTRNSLLELARHWSDIEVVEREISLHEVIDAHQEGRIIEIFGAGTACIVSPVKEIAYNGKRLQIPVKEDSLAQRAVKELTGIQFGRPEMLKKYSSWLEPVD